MGAMNLMLHCGGSEVPRAELAKVVTPEATETWRPIGHADYADMVQDELENMGLRVVSEAHGLTKSAKNFDGSMDYTAGGNYFGLYEVTGPNVAYKDHTVVVGLRNSHIKRFGAGLVAGSGVFVCDNLCFFGEIKVGRKHTKNAMDEALGIRPLVVDAISKLLIANDHQEVRFEEYKSKQMDRGSAEVVMIDALREGVVTSTQLPKVVEQWDAPDHEEFAKHKNGWRLFNGFTEALKGTSPIELPRRTVKLHQLMDKACELPIFGMDEALAEAA